MSSSGSSGSGSVRIDSPKLGSTTCMICFNTFEDPQILLCGHSICKGCVSRSVAMQKALKTIDRKERKKLEKRLTSGPEKEKEEKDKKEEETDKDEEECVICPLCRRTTPLSKVHDNIILRNAISTDAFVRSMNDQKDENGAAKGPACGFCSKPATKFCCFCGPLCEEHNNFLHIAGPLSSHEVSSAPMPLLQTQRDVRTAVMGVKSVDELDLPSCADHQRPVSLYCSKCGTLVCSICAVSGKHKGHDMKSLEETLRDSEKLIVELSKQVAEKKDVCTDVIASFEKCTGPSSKEREETLTEVRDFFGNLRKELDEKEAQVCKKIDEVFDEFNKTAVNRLEGARFLRSQCERLLQVSEPLCKKVNTDDGKGPELSVTQFMLAKSLQCALTEVEAMDGLRLGDDSSICKVIFPKEPEKLFSGLCRVRPQFLFGSTKTCFVSINFDTIGDTRTVDAFSSGHSGAHDGGAALDPTRRLIVATCGNFDSGRSISIIHLPPAGHEGATVERRENIVPFGTHGQYVVSDGVQYIYFFQSEDGPNNRMGRLNLDDFTFETLAELPREEFREFSSGCFHHGLLYMLGESYRLWCYNPEDNTWRETRVSLPRSARLLSDPASEFIYAVCSDRRGVQRINTETEDLSELTETPGSFSLGANNDAALVRVSSDVFAIFIHCENAWQVYNSESNSWTALRNWADTSNGSGHIVVDEAEGFIYYHCDGHDTYYAVNIAA